MNCHTKLKLHLERHAYKRGRNKGEAPADQHRRAKTHFRVIQANDGHMIVRFHGADLLRAYEDGHIVLNTQGWHGSPTTRSAMNDALCFFGMGGVSSVRKGGYSQTGIRMNGKTYRYYDGMEFAADGTLLTEAKQFTAKRTDREETAEFRQDIKESGFFDMFPILYAAATVPEQGWLATSAQKLMTSDYHANQWPDLVALAKYPNWRARHLSHPAHPDHKAALRALIASVTKNMTMLVDTGETVL
jgi:hypothetical protein